MSFFLSPFSVFFEPCFCRVLRATGVRGAGGGGQLWSGFQLPSCILEGPAAKEQVGQQTRPHKLQNCKVKRRLDSPKCLACRVSSLHAEPENHEVVVVFFFCHHQT